MTLVTKSIRSLGLWISVCVPIHALLVLAILLLPVLGHASATFVWVPNDGSSSSGSLKIDAPDSGYFSLPRTAVTSFDFTFRPGLSVHLETSTEARITDLPIVSFDGSSLDYGVFVPVPRPGAFQSPAFLFLVEQLGADIARYDPLGQNITVRGNWIRVDIAPPEKPPLPLGILSVIDIRPIIDTHFVDPAIGRSTANSLGLAYNPDRNVLYLSHGSDPRGGFIYTLDLNGNLLGEFNFQSAYRPGSYPTSLSYDTQTGHLFIFVLGVGDGIGKLVEMSPDGSTIFGEVTIPAAAGSITVRDDGIWQTLFASDAIRHYTRRGEFIEDVSIASSFPPGFPGPEALTTSLTEETSRGFFIVDHFGQRLVEVDREGHEIAAVTTAILGDPITADGRGLAVATDLAGQRIFLQGNNKFIFVLSAEFMKIKNVNSLVRMRETELKFDPTPVAGDRAGTLQVNAIFENLGSVDICNTFFQVVELPANNHLEGVWIEPSGQQIQGFSHSIIGHQAFDFRSGTDATFRFVIDLPTINTFNFFVNLWGTPQAPGSPCP